MVNGELLKKAKKANSPRICLIAFVLFLSSCTSQTKESEESASDQAPVASEPVPPVDICDCLQESTPEDCLNQLESEGRVIDNVVPSPCFTELGYVAAAEKICSCFNSLDQVGLACDEVQMEIDAQFTPAEQVYIQAIFNSMHCSPE